MSKRKFKPQFAPPQVALIFSFCYESYPLYLVSTDRTTVNGFMFARCCFFTCLVFFVACHCLLLCFNGTALLFTVALYGALLTNCCLKQLNKHGGLSVLRHVVHILLYFAIAMECLLVGLDNFENIPCRAISQLKFNNTVFTPRYGPRE